MDKTLFGIKSGSTNLFVELSAIVLVEWTADGANVYLLGGHRINITNDAAIELTNAVSSLQAAQFASKVGLDSPQVSITPDLNGGNREQSPLPPGE